MSTKTFRPILMVIALIASGCGGGGSDGRSAGDQAAIDQAVATLVGSGFSQRAAECYATGLMDSFGLDVLAEIGGGASIPKDVSDRAAELLVNCDVISDLGGTVAPGDQTGPTYGDYRDNASPRDQVDGPYEYGDDADLDALWDQCAAGSGEACDSLFFDSPIGSIYEAFGNSCGNRPEYDYDCTTLDG